MDDEIKNRLSKIEKRLDEIEDFLEQMPVLEKTTPYSEGDAVDELYDKALWISIQHDRVSASLLQRRLQVGYNRAARILEQLGENGIIEKREDNVPRKVLITKEDIDALRSKLEEKFDSLRDKKKKN